MDQPASAPSVPAHQPSNAATAAEAAVDLMGMPLEALRSWVVGLGERRFRADQIYKWMYQKGARDFDAMTDVSKKFRALLARRARISQLQLVSSHPSSDGSCKLVWGLHDGLRIESVILPDDNRVTLCISSQVGCALDCDFCVTGKGGFTRNLTSAEIVLQVLQSQEHSERRLSNIVLMGMGEPLLNLDNVLDAMSICMNDNALGMSHRRITLSTSGLPHKMRELNQRSPINLAISLHATTQEGRRRIMPISRKYPLEEVLDCVRELDLGRKQVTIEYTLLAGINDDIADARRLAKLLRGMPVKINLIPYNANPMTDYERPTDRDILAYQAVLMRAGYNTIIRTNRGNDVNAACGQLGGYTQKRPPRSSRLTVLAPGAAAVAHNQSAATAVGG